MAHLYELWIGEKATWSEADEAMKGFLERVFLVDFETLPIEDDVYNYHIICNRLPGFECKYWWLKYRFHR